MQLIGVDRVALSFLPSLRWMMMVMMVMVVMMMMMVVVVVMVVMVETPQGNTQVNLKTHLWEKVEL